MDIIKNDLSEEFLIKKDSDFFRLGVSVKKFVILGIFMF